MQAYNQMLKHGCNSVKRIFLKFIEIILKWDTWQNLYKNRVTFNIRYDQNFTDSKALLILNFI